MFRTNPHFMSICVRVQKISSATRQSRLMSHITPTASWQKMKNAMEQSTTKAQLYSAAADCFRLLERKAWNLGKIIGNIQAGCNSSDQRCG